MQEVEAMDFFNRLVSDKSETETVTLELEDGASLDVTLHPVNRKKVLDELSRLPPAFIEIMMEADEADEIEEKAQNRDLLTNINGDTIDAFENICAASIEHEDLTSHHVNQMVENFSFETLFPIGSKVIAMSLEQSGSVTDFHGLDLDRNS